MDYNAVIELDNVTLDDCLNLYESKKITAIINDGRIVNFTKGVDHDKNN